MLLGGDEGRADAPRGVCGMRCVCVCFQDTLLKCSKLFLVAGCTDSSSWESEHASNSASGRGGPDHRWCSFSILNILQIYPISFSLRNISFLLTALPLSRDVAQSQLLLLRQRKPKPESDLREHGSVEKNRGVTGTDL